MWSSWNLAGAPSYPQSSSPVWCTPDLRRNLAVSTSEIRSWRWMGRVWWVCRCPPARALSRWAASPRPHTSLRVEPRLGFSATRRAAFFTGTLTHTAASVCGVKAVLYTGFLVHYGYEYGVLPWEYNWATVNSLYNNDCTLNSALLYHNDLLLLQSVIIVMWSF